jgi:predicted transposase/invertase (TIGR01784 family)
LVNILRNTIVDVRCTDSDGRQFLVEMQLYWDESFKSRVMFNASKAYVIQLEKAQDFNLLKPVYALNFVNETFEKAEEMENEYYHHFQMVNIKHTGRQIEGLELIFIELPKFTPQNQAEKKLHELWLRFLTEINENTEEVPQELLDNELTREAVEYMKRSAYTKEQLDAYNQWKIDTMTARSMIENAEIKGRAEGEAERAQLQAEKDAIQAERDAVQAEKDAIQAEKDAIQANLLARIAELEKLMSARI